MAFKVPELRILLGKLSFTKVDLRSMSNMVGVFICSLTIPTSTQLLSFHLFETMAATFDVQMEMQTTKERPRTISRTSIVYSDESPPPTQPPHTPIIPMLSMAAEADIVSLPHSHCASSIDRVPLNLSVHHPSTSSAEPIKSENVEVQAPHHQAFSTQRVPLLCDRSAFVGGAAVFQPATIG